MLALFRQFVARTESSMSFTLMFKSFFSRVFSWFISSGVSSNSIWAVVVVHEDVEMMAKDGRSLKQRVVRCDPAVGPDLQNQVVVVGTLADAGISDAVLDTDYWRKNRIKRNNTERHIRTLVF